MTTYPKNMEMPAGMIPDEHWTCGLCSTFAARLRQRFGGELWAVVNHSRKYNDDQLWHAYCIIGDVAYDANGGHTTAEASDCSEERWPVPEMDKKCDVVMEWRRVDETWLDNVHADYNPDDFPAVDEYVRRHGHLFADLLHKVPGGKAWLRAR